MPSDFLVARNPEPDSRLPWLIRVPLGTDGVVLKAREPWPRTAKVYCHRAEWPEVAELVERVPTRSCIRRGAAIDLVLSRGRENRSQFVLTYARGREVIFWQTSRTAKQARPHVRPPTARAGGRESVEIIVDAHEKYAWRFADLPVTLVKRALVAGDYGVELSGALAASVERKSLPDLVGTLASGRMRYLLADLAALPRAAVVVEDRYSRVFAQEHVRPSVVAEGLAECQARFPSVPIVFAETRALAQQWTYRFLAACLDELEADAEASGRVAELPIAPGVPDQPDEPDEPGRRRAVRRPDLRFGAPGVATAEIRAWAVSAGLPVGDRGRLGSEVIAAYVAANAGDASR